MLNSMGANTTKALATRLRPKYVALGMNFMAVVGEKIVPKPVNVNAVPTAVNASRPNSW